MKWMYDGHYLPVVLMTMRMEIITVTIRQAITCTDVDLLSIGHLCNNTCKSLSMEQTTELMVVHPNNSFEVHGKNTKRDAA